MPPGTTVARLRMEVITKTRIVRRVVDVSTNTRLQTVARIIRTARGWWEKRQYRFNFGDQKYGDGHNRGAGVRQAQAKHFGEALGKNTEFEFVHDITGGTAQQVVVESVTETNMPETAYPKLIQAAGTLAIVDLTPDDAAHHWVDEANDPRAGRRQVAIDMLIDESERADHDHRCAEMGVETIRRARRGALRSHQEGSARKPTAGGLDAEAEAEPPDITGATKYKPIVLRMKTETERPNARGPKYGTRWRTSQRRKQAS